MSASEMWRRSSRKCAVMPSPLRLGNRGPRATDQGYAPPRALRTVATWSMLTPRRSFSLSDMLLCPIMPRHSAWIRLRQVENCTVGECTAVTRRLTFPSALRRFVLERFELGLDHALAAFLIGPEQRNADNTQIVAQMIPGNMPRSDRDRTPRCENVQPGPIHVGPVKTPRSSAIDPARIPEFPPKDAVRPSCHSVPNIQCPVFRTTTPMATYVSGLPKNVAIKAARMLPFITRASTRPQKVHALERR